MARAGDIRQALCLSQRLAHQFAPVFVGQGTEERLSDQPPCRAEICPLWSAGRGEPAVGHALHVAEVALDGVSEIRGVEDGQSAEERDLPESAGDGESDQDGENGTTLNENIEE